MLTKTPKKYFEFALQVLLATLIFLNAVTLVPISFIFFFLLRNLVQKLAQNFRKDLKHLMKMVSTVWAAGEEMSEKSKINMCWFLVFDGHIDLEDFQKAFQERVIQKKRPNGELMYPELKMYWTTFLNYIFWKEEENFDLGDHVRLYDYNGDFKGGESEEERAQLRISCPGEGFCDESDLRRILGPLLRKAYAKNKSPWEMLLIQNFKSPANSSSAGKQGEGSTVLVIRPHHALLDGYSLVKLIARDLMQEDLKICKSSNKMEGWERILFNAILPLKMSWDMVQAVLNSFDGGHCWNRWGRKGKLSGRVWTSISNPIDDKIVKVIKNKYGVGYNDVLCAVAASVCRRMMEEAGQEVPEQISCSIPFPLEGHPDGLVNHMTWHIFKWPMGKFNSNEVRLRTFSKLLAPSKFYTAPKGFALLAKYCNYLPSTLLTLLRTLPFTVTLSSFPFSSVPLHLDMNGVRLKLVDVIGSVGPGDGTVGTGIAMVSYNGRQKVVAIIDKIYFPSEDTFLRYGQYVEEELQYLLETKL